MYFVPGSLSSDICLNLFQKQRRLAFPWYKDGKLSKGRNIFFLQILPPIPKKYHHNTTSNEPRLPHGKCRPILNHTIGASLFLFGISCSVPFIIPLHFDTLLHPRTPTSKLHRSLLFFCRSAKSQVHRNPP